MSRVTIKICGMTRSADVDAAVRLGADALGFNFADSPRRLEVEQAGILTREAGSGIMRVGLFMDQESADIERILDAVELDLLQFHGLEGNAFCKGFGIPFIKAISMLGENPEAAARDYPDASGILLDSHRPGERGGTGHRFDWRERPRIEQPLWLAGGLTPANVAEAIALFEPFAVDVSSGVESAPGRKDEGLMSQFIEQVKTHGSH